ncbi:zinc finger X-chromosomal protein-like isoform X1, partial [Clarias magur]
CLAGDGLTVSDPVRAGLGQSASLSCKVNGKVHVSQSQWTRCNDSQPFAVFKSVINGISPVHINESYQGQVSITGYHTLTFHQVREANLGEYCCKVTTFPSGSLEGRVLLLRHEEKTLESPPADDGGMCGEEYVVELQETVLLSDGENDAENDGVAVRSFSSDELVIQDAVEDVVADDDEGVTVETCVMSLEGEEDEEDGVTVAEEELVEERENELHSSGDYLMISLDEDGKMVSADGEEVTVEGPLDDQEVEKDEDGQEVIKVYIFKADSGDDELGEGDSDSVCKPLREKMLYMSVSDGHHTHTDGGSKLSDEVYMEVVVGGEEPVCNDRSYESKEFMPVNWTAAYDDSECCENRNGAASAVLHIDESEMPHTLKQQHGKTHRRAEHRQVQT